MPELPEVQGLVDFLDERLSGLAVEALELASFSVLKTFDPPPQALEGAPVDGVNRHGKFIDIDCGGTHLVFHLARAGWLRWSDAMPATVIRPGKSPIALRARFDRIFGRQTDSVMLDRLLARLHRRKHELLRVLQHPEIPLHTNGSENDIRACVTKRKISGGTMSKSGRTARDVLLGLMKTCKKLGISFWNYLGNRFGVEDAGPVPDLAGVVRARCAA